jgi:two-component system, sensor histidine kinase PdtaS
MQKIKVSILFISLLIFSAAFSQNKTEIDSLTKVLASSAEDTNHVIILSKLTHEYTLTDPNKAFEFGQTGLTLAGKLNFKKGAALCLSKIGVIYFNRGVYDKAAESYLLALNIDEVIGNKRGYSENLCNLGTVFRIQKKYKEALDYQFKALKIDQELALKNDIAADQTNIGNTYLDMGDEKLAISYYKKALATYDQLGDKQNEATVLNNLGALYFNQNDLVNAKDNFNKALKVFEQSGDRVGVAMGLNNVAEIFLNEQNYKKALEYSERSLAIAKEIDAKDIQQYNYENLSTIYFKLNDFKKAYENQKLYHEASSSLLNTETARQINELSIKYESEKKARENIALKKLASEHELSNARQRELSNYLIAIILLIAIVGFVFYNRSRIKQNMNKDLEKIVLERTAELEFKNKQKELMLQEIHHRVKNNLQLITSMLRMQRHFKGGKNVDEILDVCANRIKCMAILHDKLYESSDFSEINAHDYFTELSGYVSKNYDSNTKIELDVVPVNLHINKLIPCGLILNELVSNAHKYAFTDENKDKMIDISFRKIPLNGFQLKVKDNGVGLPAGFDVNNLSGLGLTIVQSLVEQLDGKISFENEEGVLVDISFPG